MRYAIGYKYIRHSEHLVVGVGLEKSVFADRDRGCFVFDYYEWLEIVVVNHRVAATFHAIKRNRHFVCYERGRVVAVSYQKSHKVLPDPFFGCKCDIAFAQGVEDKVFFLFVPDICIYVWPV